MPDYRTDWDTTSFSELATLATCEQKWYRRYVLREPTDSGPAAVKGTLWHTGTAALYENGNDLEAALAALDDEVELAYPEGPQSEAEIKAVVDAAWLVARYSRHYASVIKKAEVVATEQRLERTLHFPVASGRGNTDWCEVTVKCDIDQLLRSDGKLWLREAKSSGRRDILDLAPVLPQISLYWWATEEWLDEWTNDKLYGVMFDFAYTYRWKATKPTQSELIDAAVADGTEPWLDPGALRPVSIAKREWAKAKVASHPGIERPDSESFEMQWLDRTPDQVDGALSWAQDILERREYLTHFVPGIDRTPAIRNIGPACRGCDHQSTCYEGLSFPQDDISLVLD